jgi:amino acid transporter
MFGAIAIAFALESFPHFYLAILLGIVAIIGHLIKIFIEIFTGVLGHHAFLLTSSFLLLIATIITFITGWIVRKRIPSELKEFY